MKKVIFLMVTVASAVALAVETEELLESGFDVEPSIYDEKPLDASLVCKAFSNGEPKGEVQIDIKGKKAAQKTLEVRTPRNVYRAQLVWDGYYGNAPKNPEVRIQKLNREKKVEVESYKNIDLQRIEKSDDCCEADNVGLRTADDAIYLGCSYEKK